MNKDYDRIVEIHEEMIALLEEAKQIVRRNGTPGVYDLAKSYWINQISNALTTSCLCPESMEDTIKTLEPYTCENCDEDEDECVCEDDEECTEEE